MSRIRRLCRLIYRARRRRPFSSLVRFLSPRSRAYQRSGGPNAPICESVKEWAATKPESDYRMLLPLQQITRKPPQTIEPAIDPQYLDRQVAILREKYLVRIDGASIVNSNGLVRLPDGSYASESVYARATVEQDRDYYAPRRRRVVRKRGGYFSLLLVVAYSINYYHWLHDTLQRLVSVVEWLPEDTKFIVPARLNSFHRETLRLVGIQDHQLAFYAGHEIWELETLYFSPPTTNSGSHRREADEWLRDTIMHALRVESTTPHRRIFISRQAAHRRKLLNEQTLVAYLERYGFETCVPETLSFQDQAELFAEASVIVSTHGAGLMNMLFSPPGAIVVDMVPPSMMNFSYIYWTMCEALAHRYWYFITEEVPRISEEVPRDGDRFDTLVPMEKVAATFDRLQLR